MSKIDLYPTTKSAPSTAKVATGTNFAGDKTALDVNVLNGTVTGEVHIQAPTGPFLVTVATITDTASNPLASALSDRVAVSIRNKGPATIYLGPTSGVTADNAATGGWEIGPDEDFHIELDATEVFYLITPSGQTATIKLLEIAST